MANVKMSQEQQADFLKFLDDWDRRISEMFAVPPEMFRGGRSSPTEHIVITPKPPPGKGPLLDAVRGADGHFKVQP